MESEESVRRWELNESHTGGCKAKTDDRVLVSFDGDVGLARKIFGRRRDDGDWGLGKLVGKRLF
jgi:hypothetical protein